MLRWEFNVSEPGVGILRRVEGDTRGIHGKWRCEGFGKVKCDMGILLWV